MKIVGERWKSMTVEEKAPYEEISRQRHIELNGMSSYYPTSTVKTESNDNNMKEILRIYTNAICQFFNSNMTSKLKQDNKEVTDEIIKTAIDSSWVKMSESQKYMYFLQNEKEIKDLHSILQDTEECPDNMIKSESEIPSYIVPPLPSLPQSSLPTAPTTASPSSPFSLEILKSVQAASTSPDPLTSLTSLILPKLSNLPQTSETQSLSEKTYSILSELDTCILIDSIDRLTNINQIIKN